MQRPGQKQQRNAGSEVIYWLWLNSIAGVGNVTRHRLIELFGTPENVYDAQPDELYTYQKVLGNQRIEAIIRSKSLDHAKMILEKCNKSGIQILTFDQPFFPESMKEIKALPVLLYYKGNGVIDRIHGTAIVGARRCTKEDKEKAVKAAEHLCREGIPVISGMAKGIDSYAHTVCIKQGGFPIAVLGNGLDICYPKEHQQLMDAIEETGLLLSEYPPGRKPQAYQFPQRNRIMAALADTVIVIGAGNKSGANITAGFAEDYGKSVVYQGDEGSPHFAGFTCKIACGRCRTE